MSVEQEVQALREELDALKAAHHAFRGMLLTPDNYLQYERLPQLVGGVTHLAGSEEVLAGDRWEVQAPTFYQVLSVDAGSQTVTVLNQTETGRLITVGVVTAKSTGSNGQSDVYLDFTIDGGTKRSFQLCFSDRQFGRIWDPHVTKRGATGTGQSGSALGDSLLLHFNIAYETSILIEARVVAVASYVGDEWDLGFSVVRGVLT